MNFKVIAQSGLKIRSGPSQDDEEVGLLANGEVVISPTEENGYVPMILEDDTLGWIAKQYIQEAPEIGREIEAIEIASISDESLPIFQRDLVSKFGYPKERAGYLTTIDLREFAQHLGHVRDWQGNLWSCRIYGHEMMILPLKKAFAAMVDKGLAGELKTFDGCFCIRPMKAGTKPSVHGWGMAVDFNALTNPFGRKLITDFSDEFVACFKEAGFTWGGDWGHPNFDAMHFQLPKI